MVTEPEPKTARELGRVLCGTAQRRDAGIGRGLAELVEKARRELLRGGERGRFERDPVGRYPREWPNGRSGTRIDNSPGRTGMPWISPAIIARER